MKKIVAFLICFLSFITVQAEGLEVVSITPKFNENENIRIKEAEEDYNFNILFSKKDQEATYKAIIKNNEEDKISIEDVSLKSPNSETLSFSYEGIDNSYVINPGEQKEILLKLKTLSKVSKSINEKYNLQIKYLSNSEEKTNPNTSSGKAIITFSILALSLLAVIVLYKKYHGKAFMVLIIGIGAIAINVVAKEEKTLSITGNVDYKATFIITIDPNKGIYDGEKSEEFQVEVIDGDFFQVKGITRDNHEFQGWERNPDEILVDNSQITVDQNISIKALWDEVYYVLTIDTDGGTYKGITGTIKNSYRPNESINIVPAEKDGYEFNHWEDEDGNVVTLPLSLTKDMAIKATYEDKYLNVTIKPNGGKFNGSEEEYTDSVKYNTTIDISDIEREEYTFKGWKKNNNNIITTNEITITEDTTLEATWESIIKHTITIDPNGGTYKGNDEIVTETINSGLTYTLVDPSREGYVFEGWTYEDGTKVTNPTFDVIEEVHVVATWSEIVCRIEDVFYSSIMKAHAAAEPNDTIVLLKDTHEVVTNSKKVTLDLNNHKVTGSLTNTSTGDITIINGIIENPDGIAVTNDGILIIGIDDLKDDGTSNIIRDNVQIIGTTVGLKQNNIFYYYDGFIEGDIALEGGYDGSPYYRNTFDDTIVHYFPFVDHNHEKDCQHVELEASDKAVSKTTVHGDIYYYNLQDNINTSARTGYAMYAVRDFEAAYSLTIPKDKKIKFDITGYNVNIGESITNNGTFDILDSKDNVGKISIIGKIDNNGTLKTTGIKIESLSGNNLVNNNDKLIIKNSTLKSKGGYTVYNNNNTIEFSIDKDTVLEGDSYTIYNPINNELVLTKGTVGGIDNYGSIKISNESRIISSTSYINNHSGNIEINGGTLEFTNNGNCLTSSGGTITINAGTISCTNSTFSNIVMDSTTLNINGGTLNLTSNLPSSGSRGMSNIYVNNNSVLNMTNGKINSIVKFSNGWVNGGINIDSKSSFNFSGGEIESRNISTPNNSYMAGVRNSGTFTMSGGTLNADYNAVANGGTFTITGGSIEGLFAAVSSSKTANIYDGTLKGNQYGLYLSGGTTTLGENENQIDIEKPDIQGNTYGLYVSSGTLNFYDGVLKGKTGAFYGIISKIADDAYIFEEIRSIEEEAYYVDYLKTEQYIVKNTTTNDTYTNLTDAINELEPSQTLEMIEDAQLFDQLVIDKDFEVKIDINGKELRFNNPITNRGELTIINTNDEEQGRITTYLASYLIINESGSTLTIKDITLDSMYILHNQAGASFIGKNVDLTSSNTAIKNEGSLDIDEFEITGTTYALYIASNEENMIKNTSITSNSNPIYNNSTNTTTLEKVNVNGLITNSHAEGTLKFMDSTIAYPSTNSGYIDNKGIMILNKTTLTGTYHRAIVNSGTLTIENDSTISIDSSSRRNSEAYIVDNNNTVNIYNSNLTLNLTNSNTYNNVYNASSVKNKGTLNIIESNLTVTIEKQFNGFGVYNDKGSVIMESGHIRVEGPTTYGIYLNEGSVVLGIPEPVDSINYGGEFADVSLTNPLIEAIGTTSGTGVKSNNGRLKYYDGKILGSHLAKPEVAADIEYLYEAIDHIEDGTGYKYCVLEWMRNSGGN